MKLKSECYKDLRHNSRKSSQAFYTHVCMYVCWCEYFQQNLEQCSDKELGRVVLEIERIALLATIGTYLHIITYVYLYILYTIIYICTSKIPPRVAVARVYTHTYIL